MNNYIKSIYILVLTLISGQLMSQITISNGSFEGQPADATMPSAWSSASKGTTPDILPGFWGVYLEPDDGESYLGLISREDGSIESITQRLEGELIPQECYSMSVSLAYSDTYTGYNTPIGIKIWLSKKKKKRQVMIFESGKIDNLDWEIHNIDFTPESSYKYIIIEVYPLDNQQSKGNILIDSLTSPKKCNRA